MDHMSCSICQDLIPLVQDGVASEDSRQAVERHTAACESCRTALEHGGVPPCMDDGRVLAGIRRRLMGGATLLMVLGVLVGLGLSESGGMLYNILILPAVGALGYFALRRRAALAPLGLFFLVYLWHLCKYLLSGEMADSAAMMLLASLYWSVLYSVLCALGTAIAALLHYAFRREGSKAPHNL